VYTSTAFNWTQTFCMLIGRYFELIPALALAGALAKKKAAAAKPKKTAGSRSKGKSKAGDL